MCSQHSLTNDAVDNVTIYIRKPQGKIGRYLTINSTDPNAVVRSKVVDDVTDEDIGDLPCAAEHRVHVFADAFVPFAGNGTLVDFTCWIC